MKKSLLLAVVLFFVTLTVQAENCAYWENLKTGKSECIVGFPASDKMNQFISQDPAAQELYQTYIAMGKSPAESLELVLKQALGSHQKNKGVRSPKSPSALHSGFFS